MVVLVHMTADGRCAVTYPAKGYSLDAVIESLRRPGHNDRIPDGVEPVQMDAADVLPEPHYRGARKLEGEKVVHDMTRAREIHRNRIRSTRAGLMNDLDTQFMRALETGSDTKDIVAEKQRLRDAPAHPDIDKAQTVDDLKRVWPL